MILGEPDYAFITDQLSVKAAVRAQKAGAYENVHKNSSTLLILILPHDCRKHKNNRQLET